MPHSDHDEARWEDDGGPPFSEQERRRRGSMDPDLYREMREAEDRLRASGEIN